jgi:hypothetical protein
MLRATAEARPKWKRRLMRAAAGARAGAAEVIPRDTHDLRGLGIARPGRGRDRLPIAEELSSLTRAHEVRRDGLLEAVAHELSDECVSCETAGVVEVLLLGGGFMLGLALGRWWGLLAAVALGVWIASVTEVEVPHWFLGVAYTALSGVGIAGGVGLRRSLHRRDSQKR